MQRPRWGTSNNFIAAGRSRVCVGLLLARLDVLCAYCAASSVFALASSSNRQMLVLLLCTVRVKRRVGTAALFLSRKAAAQLSECFAVVEVASVKPSKTWKLEEKKQLEALG